MEWEKIINPTEDKVGEIETDQMEQRAQNKTEM